MMYILCIYIYMCVCERDMWRLLKIVQHGWGIGNLINMSNLMEDLKTGLALEDLSKLIEMGKKVHKPAM